MSLVHGTWDVKNEDGVLERVRPQDIKTTALLTIEGELDDISGSGQTRAAHDLCTGIVNTEQTHFEAKGAGHYGIFSGRRWRELVYPKVQQFIAQHNGATPAASPTVAPNRTRAKAAPLKSATRAPARKKVSPSSAPTSVPSKTLASTISKPARKKA